MGDFEVKQRINDSMFFASHLLEQWNKNTDNGSRKRIDKFLTKKETTAFVDEIKTREAIGQKIPLADFQEVKEPYVIIKGRNTKDGKTKDKVWMHPYLFIDFAMWLNPSFKYDVIKFVYDQLIQCRHKAGDNYKLLNSAIEVFKPTIEQRKTIAKAFNYTVFRRHEKGLRDTATEEQLEAIHKLEDKYSMLISDGYIKTYDQLLFVLRKEYYKSPF